MANAISLLKSARISLIAFIISLYSFPFTGLVLEDSLIETTVFPSFATIPHLALSEMDPSGTASKRRG